MSSRPVLDVPTPPGGWVHPWPNVGQIAAHGGPEDWTLVGGLMVAVHAAASGIRLPRTTVDVDMVIHVETARGRVARIRMVLGELGYALMEPSDARRGTHIASSDQARRAGRPRKAPPTSPM